jgi:hypothetical protein
MNTMTVSAQAALMMMIALAMVAAGLGKKRLEWRGRKTRDWLPRRFFRRHDEKPS